MIYKKKSKKEIEKILDKRNRRAVKVYDKKQIKKRNSFLYRVKNILGNFGR